MPQDIENSKFRIRIKKLEDKTSNISSTGLSASFTYLTGTYFNSYVSNISFLTSSYIYNLTNIFSPEITGSRINSSQINSSNLTSSNIVSSYITASSLTASNINATTKIFSNILSASNISCSINLISNLVTASSISVNEQSNTDYSTIDLINNLHTTSILVGDNSKSYPGLSIIDRTYNGFLANFSTNGSITLLDGTGPLYVLGDTQITGAISSTSNLTINGNTKLGVVTGNSVEITGSLYVTGGIGSGIIRGREINIQDDRIELRALNRVNDTSQLAINYNGYNGGTTYFRSTNIFNGKQSCIALFDGQNNRVGIGTVFNPASTLPEEKLEIRTNTSNYGLLHSDGTVKVGSYIDATGGWFGTKNNYRLHFFTNNGSARMTVNTDGNIGIAKTVPQYPLHVGGSTAVNEAYAYLNSAASVGTFTGSTNVAIRADARIMCAEFNAVSDERNKEIYQDIQYDLKDKFKNINIVTFKHRNEFNINKNAGVIAQEIEKIFPDCVQKHTDYVYDIFCICDLITKLSDNDYQLIINKNIDLQINDEIKIYYKDLEYNEQKEISLFIKSIINNKTFIVNSPVDITNECVIIGRKVNDYRSVNYQYLNSLNIKMTQELIKENDYLKNKLEEKENQINNILARLIALENK